MHPLVRSTMLALRSLFIPGMMGVLVYSLFLTLILLLLLAYGLSHLTAWLAIQFFSLNAADHGWLALVSGGGSLMLVWFLFPGIMPIIVNFFDTRIASLIEANHYPNLPPPQNPAFWPEFWHDVRFSLSAIGLNLLVLPLYPAVAVLFPFIFYGLNGYLLGREFFATVAKRYVPLEEVRALRRTHRNIIWAGGIMLAIAATVPFANLFAPFWGIALMTHLYHAIKK